MDDDVRQALEVARREREELRTLILDIRSGNIPANFGRLGTNSGPEDGRVAWWFLSPGGDENNSAGIVYDYSPTGGLPTRFVFVQPDGTTTGAAGAIITIPITLNPTLTPSNTFTLITHEHPLSTWPRYSRRIQWKWTASTTGAAAAAEWELFDVRNSTTLATGSRALPFTGQWEEITDTVGLPIASAGSVGLRVRSDVADVLCQITLLTPVSWEVEG